MPVRLWVPPAPPGRRRQPGRRCLAPAFSALSPWPPASTCRTVALCSMSRHAIASLPGATAAVRTRTQVPKDNHRPLHPLRARPRWPPKPHQRLPPGPPTKARRLRHPERPLQPTQRLHLPNPPRHLFLKLRPHPPRMRQSQRKVMATRCPRSSLFPPTARTLRFPTHTARTRPWGPMSSADPAKRRLRPSCASRPSRARTARLPPAR